MAVSSFANRKTLIQGLTEFGTRMTPGTNQLAVLNVLGLILSDLGEKEVPEVYMAYSLYNSESVERGKGKQLLSGASKNRHEYLSDTLKVEEDGYTPRRTSIEVYLVNETSENVWFDDFTVMSSTPIIVQESHYYPFGSELTGLAYIYNKHTNRFLYQGTEYIEDQSLNIC